MIVGSDGKIIVGSVIQPGSICEIIFPQSDEPPDAGIGPLFEQGPLELSHNRIEFIPCDSCDAVDHIERGYFLPVRDTSFCIRELIDVVSLEQVGMSDP